ncbi:nitroreductase family protein [Paenibacillus eucommiae]|uniref:Nitroreductase n=1 Tax=Paenibacillus eucommiae TaxID=1355755 RepID=A0ABS4ISR9_9BACL|nr:nitroreductase [Paenibacillus eucommiae]MBP1990175.1 nitroreductase [Paenibacillus eucommiae]
MGLTELVRERRSIRKFNHLPVSQELVVELLEKATQLYHLEEAARWRYVYAGTPEARERLSDYMLEKMKENKLVKLVPDKMMGIIKKRFTEIPANLIVIAETDPDRRKSDENYAAVCSIMQIFQLLGWERGLGMLWDTERTIQNELFYQRIGVREGERFVGILHLGYFDKVPRGRGRTPAEKKWTVKG